MTTEEKAKAYDEMTRLLSNWYKNETDIGIIDHISVIYPELKESEDERIRKELIGFIENWKNPNNLGRPQDYPMFTKNEEQCNKYITWLEKQGEQKPADKVEPKFKVGDWVVFNNHHVSVYQVEKIENYQYILRHILGGSLRLYFSDDELIRLWNIEDAQDGDVLVNQNGEMPFIFSTYKENYIFCHCGYANRKNIFFDKFVDKDGSLLHWVNLFHEKVCPATKEQRDLLFQKMKEAGYKWENNQLEEINNKGFVDLGLPSGTLWATCNLGAEKETDFGYFYQWGDTHGYKDASEHQFKRNDYKWEIPLSITKTKYNNIDNKLVLDNEDDPVFVATNGEQKMPTKEQMQELIDHTNYEWIEIDGVKGMKFTNKSDDTKYIFIPAAGYYYDGSHNDVGSWVCVWSASRSEYSASSVWCMYFDAGDVDMDYYTRWYGYSVRGVMNNKNL